MLSLLSASPEVIFLSAERERERELYLQSRHTLGQPLIIAVAYDIHNNAHIEEKKNKQKQTSAEHHRP